MPWRPWAGRAERAGRSWGRGCRVRGLCRVEGRIASDVLSSGVVAVVEVGVVSEDLWMCWVESGWRESWVKTWERRGSSGRAVGALRRVAGCSARRTTRGAGRVGVEEDVGDVDHCRKHLAVVVGVAEAGDERCDPPPDAFTRLVIPIPFAAR